MPYCDRKSKFIVADEFWSPKKGEEKFGFGQCKWVSPNGKYEVGIHVFKDAHRGIHQWWYVMDEFGGEYINIINGHAQLTGSPRRIPHYVLNELDAILKHYKVRETHIIRYKK